MIDDLNQKMSNALKHLEKEFNTIRTSRANPSMLDNIFADAYGSKTPLNQLGNISTPDPSTITIQVWDTSLLKNIENSILDSGLGINPQIDGQLIRLPVPELNEERRAELKKIIKSIGEKCKVSIRNIRREANEDLKKLLKSKEIGEDDEKSYEKKVQTITDEHINSVENKVSSKEKEIMTI